MIDVLEHVELERSEQKTRYFTPLTCYTIEYTNLRDFKILID